jgi:hypothetical protein
VVEKYRNKTYTQWRTDDLLQAVLDTRLVDSVTGEVTEETPLEKVLEVWNLPAPRLTALKNRGLTPSDYATVTYDEDKPWKLRVIESG